MITGCFAHTEANDGHRNVPSDGVLLGCVAAGDQQALWDLRARYSASLYALAYSILSDRSAAQQVVDGTFRDLRNEARRFDAIHFPVSRWLSEATKVSACETRRARSANTPSQ